MASPSVHMAADRSDPIGEVDVRTRMDALELDDEIRALSPD